MGKGIVIRMAGSSKILICTDFYVNMQQYDFLNHKTVFFSFIY